MAVHGLAPPTTNNNKCCPNIPYCTYERRGEAAIVSAIRINSSKYINCTAVLPGTVSDPRITSGHDDLVAASPVTMGPPGCIERERFQWSTAIMVPSTGWADLQDTCTRTASHK